MMTVIVIGILAAMAIPNYQKSVERGYLREAEDLLTTVFYGERAYFFANNRYRADTDLGFTWNDIYMEDPNIGSIPVGFTVTASGIGPAATFTATATRQGGPCDTNTRTINDQRIFSGSWNTCTVIGTWP